MQRRAEVEELKRKRAAFAAKRKADLLEAKRRGRLRRQEAEKKRQIERKKLAELEKGWRGNGVQVQQPAPRRNNHRRQAQEYDRHEELRQARIQAYQDRMKLREKMKDAEQQSRNHHVEGIRKYGHNAAPYGLYVDPANADGTFIHVANCDNR